VETFLTLVIALRGIATGIGAIWAALAARRQTQLTEQSLARTERSFAEQSESLREQNERTRLNLEVDLLFRMADRYDSQHFMSSRRSAAKHAINNFLVEDDIVEVERLNHAAFDVANFFDQVG
jgi:hypothetical protein